MKRIFSLMLTILILVSSLSVYAFAITGEMASSNTIINQNNLSVYSNSIQPNIGLTNLVNQNKVALVEAKRAEAELKEQEQIEREKQLELDQIRASVSYSISYNLTFSDAKEYSSYQKELLAKMLYCEAGNVSRVAQILTLSAIINHIEANGGFYVLDEENHFSPAPYYRDCTPTEEQYEVVDYVLNDRVISDLKYFRINYYHSFAQCVCNIDNIYFNM